MAAIPEGIKPSGPPGRDMVLGQSHYQRLRPRSSALVTPSLTSAPRLLEQPCHAIQAPLAQYSSVSGHVFPYLDLLSYDLIQHASLALAQDPHSS